MKKKLEVLVCRQVYEFDFPGDVQHYCEVIAADPTLAQKHDSGVLNTIFAYVEDARAEDFSCSGFEITF